MTSSRCGISFILALATTFLGTPAFAQTAIPGDFTVEGRLFDSSTGNPLNSTSVDIMLEVADESTPNCVFYREIHSALNVSSASTTAQGVFAVRLGAGTRKFPVAAQPSMTKLFSAVAQTGIDTSTAVGGESLASSCSLTPTATSHRVVKVKVYTGSAWDYLSPDTTLTMTPQAAVADNAEALHGHAYSDFILTNTTTSLNQTNMESVFSATNYAKLISLLTGTSALVNAPSASVDFNAQRITGVANPTAAQDAATKNYSDTNVGGKTVDVTGVGAGVGGGRTLVWDQAQNKWVTGVMGTVTNVTAGSGLLGGTITSTGTLSVDTGTTANKILQLNSSAQIPAVDGSLLTAVSASKLRGLPVSGAVPSNNMVLTWNGSAWEGATAAVSGITALSGDVSATGPGSVAATIQPNAITSAKINNSGVAVNRLLITDATTGATVGYSTCALGEVLQWTATGWTCQSVPTLLGPTGVGASTYGNGTQVPQVTVDARGRVTNLTNVNIAFPVTSVAGRTGAVVLTAADITSGLGTAAAQNVGTGVNNVLQFTTAGQLPAVDGNNLTNINAANLNGTLNPAVLGALPYVNKSGDTMSGKLQVSMTDSTTGGSQYLSKSTYAASPASNSSTTYYAQGASVDYASSSNANAIGGLQTTTTVSGTGTLNAAYGVKSIFSQLNTGTTTAAYGYLGSLDNSSSGSIGAAYGMYSTITNSGGGTVGSGYGLYIGPIQTTNRWGVYESDSTAPNYFAGNVSVGTTTVGSSKLFVHGTIESDFGGVKFPDGTTQTTAYTGSGGSQWTTTGSDIYYNSGKVGIGTTPTDLMTVAGTSSGMIVSSLKNSNSVGTAFFAGKNDAAHSVLFGVTGTGFSSSGIYQPNSAVVYADQFLNSLNLGTEAGAPMKIFTNNTQQAIVTATGSVGIGTGNPVAILDVAATGTTSAIVVPRDSTTNRPTGVPGMIRYNTTLNKFEAFENSGWTNMIASGGPYAAQGANSDIYSLSNLNIATSTSDLTIYPANAKNLNLGNAGTNSVNLNGGSTGSINASGGYISLNSAGQVTVSANATGSSAILISGGSANSGINVQQGSTASLTLGNPASSGTATLTNGGATNIVSATGSIQLSAKSVGVNTATPQAVLDVSTSASGLSAIIVPRDVQANRPPTGVNGMIRYNQSTSRMEAFENGTWVNMIAGGGGGATFPLFGIAGGSPTAPDYSFSGSTGSGMYSPGSNLIAVATAGSPRILVDASGNVGLGGTAANQVNVTTAGRLGLGGVTSPSYSLSLSGTSAQTIGMEAPISGTVSGSDLTIAAANSKLASTDKAGGNLVLSTGTSTGLPSTPPQVKILVSPTGSSGTSTMTPIQVASFNQYGLNIGGSGGNGPLFTFSTNSTSSNSDATFQNDFASLNSPASINLIKSRAGGSSFVNDTAGEIRFSAVDSSLSSLPIAKISSTITNATAPNTSGTLNFSTMNLGTLASRMMIASNGNVGIGTTTPGYKLDVAGTINASSVLVNGTAVGMGTVAAVYPGTGLAAGPAITNVGTLNVDVGTTANKILQLNGSAQIPAVDGSLVTNVKIGGTKVSNNPPTAGQTLSYNSLSTQWESVNSWASNGSNLYYNFGSIGIGTSAPTSLLTANQNTSQPQALGALSSGTIGHFVGLDSQSARIVIDEYGANNATSGRLTFRSARGTAASPIPVQQDDLLGSINSTAYAPTGYSGSTAAINFVAAENFGSVANGTSIAFATTPTGTTGATERMRIDGSGNVGIGTLTPLYPLHIKGSNATPITFQLENSNSGSNAGAQLQLVTNAGQANSGQIAMGGPSFIPFGGPNSLNVVNNASSGPITFFTSAATERMRIAGSGYVGIGTTNPDSPLNVVATSTAGQSLQTNTVNISRTATVTSAGASPTVGIYNLLTATGSTSVTEIEGGWNYVMLSTAAGATSVYGTRGTVFEGTNQFLGNAAGVLGEFTTSTFNTNINSVAGVYGTVSGANGSTITTGVGLRAKIDPNSGTISNGYGILIDPSGATGTITNRYGLYQQGASDKNYFAGNVGIGTATPGVALEVSGDAKVKHLIGGSGSPTNGGFGTGAGSGSSFGSLTGSDIAHKLVFNAGTAPTAGSAIITVIFSNAFSSAPVCVFSPGNSFAAGLAGTNGVYITSTATGYTLNANGSAITASMQYIYYVHCIQ